MKQAKAQVFSADAVFSLMIFFAAMSIAIFLWIYLPVPDATRERAENIADYLVMQRLGAENMLEVPSIINFSAQTPGQMKSALGVPENFYFRVVNISSSSVIKYGGVVKEPIAYIATQMPADVAVMNMLNNSALVWDFYWVGSSAPAASARNTYLFGDKISAYKAMVANLQNYNTSISEDSHVKNTDLSAGEQQALRNFVNSGHNYIHIQHEEELLQVFGLTPANPSTNQGVVVALDDILYGTNIGDAITFQQGTKSFDKPSSPIPVKSVMDVAGDSSNCILCGWSYGSGYIYYMPDASNSNGNTISILNILGKIMEGGLKPQNANYVVNIRRIASLNGNYVYLDTILWK